MFVEAVCVCVCVYHEGASAIEDIVDYHHTCHTRHTNLDIPSLSYLSPYQSVHRYRSNEQHGLGRWQSFLVDVHQHHIWFQIPKQKLLRPCPSASESL